MRLLADENIHGSWVVWLRERGHDVVWVPEVEPGMPDGRVLARAQGDGRVLLTADRDFGEHVFRRGEAAHGVVLLRIVSGDPDELLARLTSAWPVIESRLPGAFVVVTNARIRVRRLPEA